MRIAATTLLFAAILIHNASSADRFQPQIPKTWDEAEINSAEIPLSHPEYSPKHLSAGFYYRMSVRPIYQSYPVYHPDREPPGYMEWLKHREPTLVWDSTKLRTREDWIGAGELVFGAPIAYGEIGMRQTNEKDIYVRRRSWYEAVRPPLSTEGVLPFVRYVIREKGKVEIGAAACAMCHSRVLPDGSVLKGGPGNVAFNAIFAAGIKTQLAAVADNRRLMEELFWKPWALSELSSRLRPLDANGLAALLDRRPQE